MHRMDSGEIEQFVAGPHVAVLSVSRAGKGPVAVPVWFEFSRGRFWISTTRATLHSRLIESDGRATLTIHEDILEAASRIESYVMAEGPANLLDEDPLPLAKRLERRYSVGERIDDWVATAGTSGNDTVLALDPETMSGYVWQTDLEPSDADAGDGDTDR